MFRLSPFMLATILASTTSVLMSQEPVLTKPLAAQEKPSPESYLVGYNMGRELLENGFMESDIIGADLVKGMLDALAKRKPLLPDDEIKAAGAAINAKLQARAAEKTKQLSLAGQANLEKSKAFLAENSKKDGVQTLKSGLQYEVITKGQGKSPSLTSTVKVHYEGKLISGVVFDGSRLHGDKPAEFEVGGVIKGWTDALQRMAVGDKWRLFIPPELAYGPNGPPSIGPNQALIFEVELIDIVK